MLHWKSRKIPSRSRQRSIKPEQVRQIEGVSWVGELPPIGPQFTTWLDHTTDTLKQAARAGDTESIDELLEILKTPCVMPKPNQDPKLTASVCELVASKIRAVKPYSASDDISDMLESSATNLDSTLAKSWSEYKPPSPKAKITVDSLLRYGVDLNFVQPIAELAALYRLNLYNEDSLDVEEDSIFANCWRVMGGWIVFPSIDAARESAIDHIKQEMHLGQYPTDDLRPYLQVDKLVKEEEPEFESQSRSLPLDRLMEQVGTNVINLPEKNPTSIRRRYDKEYPDDPIDDVDEMLDMLIEDGTITKSNADSYFDIDELRQQYVDMKIATFESDPVDYYVSSMPKQKAWDYLLDFIDIDRAAKATVDSHALEFSFGTRGQINLPSGGVAFR